MRFFNCFKDKEKGSVSLCETLRKGIQFKGALECKKPFDNQAPA